jgi:hypothetical protein
MRLHQVQEEHQSIMEVPILTCMSHTNHINGVVTRGLREQQLGMLVHTCKEGMHLDVGHGLPAGVHVHPPGYQEGRLPADCKCA